MISDLAIRRYTGADGASVRIDTLGGMGALRFSASDVADPGISNPIPIPQDGSKTASFWVTLGFDMVTDPAGEVRDLLFYTDGINTWPGTELLVATASSYAQATGVVGNLGTSIHEHPNLSSPVSNAFALTQTNSLSITGTATELGVFGELLILQLLVGRTALAGGLSDEGFHLVWKEV